MHLTYHYQVTDAAGKAHSEPATFEAAERQAQALADAHNSPAYLTLTETLTTPAFADAPARVWTEESTLRINPRTA